MHCRILLSRKIFIAMFSVLSNYHHGKHRKPCSSVMIRKNRNILFIRTLQFLRKEHLTRVQHFIPFTHCANTIKFRRKISGGPERKILLLWSYVGYFSGKGKFMSIWWNGSTSKIIVIFIHHKMRICLSNWTPESLIFQSSIEWYWTSSRIV